MAQLIDTPFTIEGVGAAVGPESRPNSWFAERMDTSDEWIFKACGIRERRVGGSTIALAVEASKAALDDAGLDASEIDVVIMATSSPELITPANAVMVHKALGVRSDATAFDVVSACGGFIVALGVANGWLRSGARRALVVGSDALSHFINYDDRASAILFADGAGAFVVSAEGTGRLLASDFGTDSSGSEHLYIPYGGKITMNGREVFKRAVSAVSASVERTLEALGSGPAQVDLLVAHQANDRIVSAVADRCGFAEQATLRHIEKIGNTSAASIPLAVAAHRDRFVAGRQVILTGFGAGISYATMALRWG